MGTVRNRSSEEKKKNLDDDVESCRRCPGKCQIIQCVCVCVRKKKTKRQFTMKNLKPASVTFLFFFFFFSFVLFGAQNIITP